MKMARVQLLLAILVSSASAWTVVPTRQTAAVVSASRSSRSSFNSNTRLFSDQWDDEEELPSVTSYDDAARGLLKRKEDQELEEFGESDQPVPGVSAF